MMKPGYLVLTSALFLHACGLLTPKPPAIEATVSPPPLQPAAQPAMTPSGIPPAEPNDPNYFRDDFDTELKSGWEWRYEDPGNWSITAVPGFLRINAGGGQVNDETIKNLLLRPAPPGNFQIETKVTFTPKANFQFAGLIIYESPTNLIQAGRAFCIQPDTSCTGDGLYVDYYEGGSFVKPNFAVSYTGGDVVHLRLARQGETYTFQSSADGGEWIMGGRTVSRMNPLRIGLLAGENTSSVIPALFDYFEVRSLP